MLSCTCLQITECGESLAAWQKQGYDQGTTAAAYPANIDDLMLALAQQYLGM